MQKSNSSMHTACRRMEAGEASYLVGKTGVEIALECIQEITGEVPSCPPGENCMRSPDYWCGWAVSFYHWYSGRPYQEIFTALPYPDLLDLYPTLHDADITKFVDIAEHRVRKHFPETNLRRLRDAYGCSQAELSRLSGVSLRSIQMYEQRRKDINKAQAETLLRLSKVLGCSMEQLMEH